MLRSRRPHKGERMAYHDAIITTKDGRALEVASVGDPQGATVVFHHGTPGSAPLVKVFDEVATRNGFFVVTMSRAGYGRSDRLAGRAPTHVVSDTNDALDHFGRGDYLVAGWSGGGPHALACAALDAPRCRAAWSLAGVAPSNGDFDWTEGMGPENVEEFALAQQGGAEYEAHIQSISETMRGATEANVIELFGGLLPPVDKDALADDAAREILAEACREAGRSGHYGFLDDDQTFVHDWGFALSDITVPTALWFGDEDLMVPPTHAKYLLDHIPGATAFHQPAEGHVSIVSRFQDELFAAFRRALA